MSGKSGTVAVLCGDPTIARIVANLLRAVGFESRPAEEVEAGELPDVSLLFIAPGEDPESDLGLPMFEAAGVPTLDLSGSSWPCRIEEIKEAVENTLS